MFVVRGTKKFLDRVGKVDAADERPSTTVLGDWYATVWFWRPQVTLFVNDLTLLPVLLPMAPASTVVQRFALGLPETFSDYGLDPRFVEAEIADMAEHRLTTTASRSRTVDPADHGPLYAGNSRERSSSRPLMLRSAGS